MPQGNIVEKHIRSSVLHHSPESDPRCGSKYFTSCLHVRDGRVVNRAWYEPSRALLLCGRSILIEQELLSCTSYPIRWQV